MVRDLSTATADTAHLGSGLALLAGDLHTVLGRLVRRLRAESRLPLTQAAVLGRLDREGAQFIGELAASESVRPQSMSQILAELETKQLISRKPDLTDGRRTRIELTPQGRVTLSEERAHRESWLASAIADFNPAEQQLLNQVVELLHRLCEAPGVR